MAILSRGITRSNENLSLLYLISTITMRMQYLYYKKTYGHQTCQGSDVL